MEFSIVKFGGLKYMNFLKGIKLDFICIKMKLMKNAKYSQQNFSRKVLVPQSTANFMSRVSKSYVPFTCKFPMAMYFVPILHRCCRSKTIFYVFSYDKTSLKFCASFSFFLAVLWRIFQKICYLNYVIRGVMVLVYIVFVKSKCDACTHMEPQKCYIIPLCGDNKVYKENMWQHLLFNEALKKNNVIPIGALLALNFLLLCRYSFALFSFCKKTGSVPDLCTECMQHVFMAFYFPNITINT